MTSHLGFWTEDLPESVMTLSQKPMDLTEFFEFFGWHVSSISG